VELGPSLVHHFRNEKQRLNCCRYRGIIAIGDPYVNGVPDAPDLAAAGGAPFATRRAPCSTPSTSQRRRSSVNGRSSPSWSICSRASAIAHVAPLHVATWIEAHTRELAAPSVKQRLAALRHLFDWLVTGHVVLTARSTS
jgi:hypothetical protein